MYISSRRWSGIDSHHVGMSPLETPITIHVNYNSLTQTKTSSLLTKLFTTHNIPPNEEGL